MMNGAEDSAELGLVSKEPYELDPPMRNFRRLVSLTLLQFGRAGLGRSPRSILRLIKSIRKHKECSHVAVVEMKSLQITKLLSLSNRYRDETVCHY
jgi:hypothetical protein